MRSRPENSMNSGWRPMLLRLALLPLLSPLAACQTTTGTGATSRSLILDFYCGENGQAGAYVPVSLSHKDTAGTIQQTEANNAVYDATCGAK